MSAANKAIVEKVNASFAEGAIEGFLSNCTDDISWTIVGNKTLKGKDTIREWLSSMDCEPPTFTVDNLVAEGDVVVANGPMMMKDQDGKTFPYAFCDIYRFRDGKIMELSSFLVKTEEKAEGAGSA